MKTFFFFFLESTCALCPWSLALASSIHVLGLESVCPRKGCPWPWPWPRIFFVSLALASSLVSSTPPLVNAWCHFRFLFKCCFFVLLTINCCFLCFCLLEVKPQFTRLMCFNFNLSYESPKSCNMYKKYSM